MERRLLLRAPMVTLENWGHTGFLEWRLPKSSSSSLRSGLIEASLDPLARRLLLELSGSLEPIWSRDYLRSFSGSLLGRRLL